MTDDPSKPPIVNWRHVLAGYLTSKNSWPVKKTMSTSSDPVMHGWYNPEATSTCFYLSEDGVTEVEVSSVEKDYDDTNRSHSTYRGRVTKYLRQGREDGREEEWLRSFQMPYKIQSFDPETVKRAFASFAKTSKPKPVDGELCPLKYYGTGVCKCGQCGSRTTRIQSEGGNVFGYTAAERTHPVTLTVQKAKRPMHTIHDESKPVPIHVPWGD